MNSEAASRATIGGGCAGRLALITGCTGGIGKATAIALAKLGCSIAVHYNSASNAASVLVTELESLGVKAASFQADLSTYAGVDKLYSEVVSQLGHPDILFNNAGVTRSRLGFNGNIQDISHEEFEDTWRTNNGTHFKARSLTQLCIPHMEAQKYGRVIFCSSVAAHTGGGIGPHYASSKSAMHGLAHWIANRYAKDGITCNVVAPALIIETVMMSNPSEELKARIPVGRFGLPNEISPIVELFVTNGYMNNKVVVADGGWTSGAF